MTNVIKNQKRYFLLHFDSVARVWVLSNGVEDATLWQFVLINLYLFDSIFTGIVRFNKLHNCVEGICLLNSSWKYMKMVKRHYLSYQSKSCKKDKILHGKHVSYTFKLPLIKLSWLDRFKARRNVATSERYILRKIAKKLKKIYAFHYCFPQLCF